MCESSVWMRYPDGRREKIADDILVIRQEGEFVELRGLFVEPRRVSGTLEEVDAMKHVVTLAALEHPRETGPKPPSEKASAGRQRAPADGDGAGPHGHTH